MQASVLFYVAEEARVRQKQKQQEAVKKVAEKEVPVHKETVP